MAGAQRKANGPRPPVWDAASARWRWPFSFLVACVPLVAHVANGHSQEALPREAPARPETVRARLPKHVRSDTGKLANTRLHGDSRINDAAASPQTGERVVVPIPARQFEEAGVRLFQRVRVRFWRGFGRLAEVGRSDRQSTDPAVANPSDVPGRDTMPQVASALATAAQPQPSAEAAPAPPTPALSSAPPAARAIAAPPEKAAGPDLVTLEADVFDQIRMEIKARLPYFQRCVEAARRRGLSDIRRLQATWLISEDGSIKDLQLEGVTDELLATCIMRMGSRPFPVSPGTELTIPTPIVFVR